MTADEQMKRMSLLTAGKNADFFLQYAEPYFQDIERSVTAQMKVQYRTGQYTEGSLIASVAQLCVIDDMRQKLKSKINSMNSVIKEDE